MAVQLVGLAVMTVVVYKGVCGDVYLASVSNYDNGDVESNSLFWMASSAGLFWQVCWYFMVPKKVE